MTIAEHYRYNASRAGGCTPRCAGLPADIPQSTCDKRGDVLNSQPHVSTKEAALLPHPHMKHPTAAVPRTRIQLGQAPALTLPNRVRWISSRVCLFVMCHIPSPSSYHADAPGSLRFAGAMIHRGVIRFCSKPWRGGGVYLFHSLTPLACFRS